MELGRCPRCSRPYTASEVVGFGVLRARRASDGGPRVEFTCPECSRTIQLIPHGLGRYAPPGQPPPEEVPEDDRRPPWMTDRAPRGPAAGTAPANGRTRTEPTQAATEAPWREEVPPAARAEHAEPEHQPAEESDAPPSGEPPLGPAEALALLGCKATADREELERAFRARSLTCHPDKVAHLDADFQALAERKFKRLREALDLLTS